jgi:adenine phosphoribosyltransferase
MSGAMSGAMNGAMNDAMAEAMNDAMSDNLARDVLRTLRPIPDYPKPGVVFQDITPVLRDGRLFRRVVEAMAKPFAGAGITHVLGIEARGFILGGPVATVLGAGFVPARKPGKLPWESVREAYELEYGSDALEAHRDSWAEAAKVLVVDDVLATGGTARAAGQLARALGAELAGWSFLLEIAALGGRAKLAGAACKIVASV